METEKKEDRSELAWTSLFQMDELAAHQYRQTFCRQLPRFPELALLVAVLEDVSLPSKRRYLRGENTRNCLKTLKIGSGIAMAKDFFHSRMFARNLTSRRPI